MFNFTEAREEEEADEKPSLINIHLLKLSTEDKDNATTSIKTKKFA